jgi:hypothetical protein
MRPPRVPAWTRFSPPPRRPRTWLTVSPRGGNRFRYERQIAPVFDHLLAPVAGGNFLGDYESMAAFDDQFRPLFVATNNNRPNNRTDVFYGQFAWFDNGADRAKAAPSPQTTTLSPASATVKQPLRFRL